MDFDDDESLKLVAHISFVDVPGHEAYMSNMVSGSAVMNSTILVVATYLTVSVLKAFDIVYVTTRGDFETNLLAVKMLDEFAKFLNQGRSAAVAVIIFISVTFEKIFLFLMEKAVGEKK